MRVHPMENRSHLLRYTLLTLRLDLFWLPAALWALFLIIVAITIDDPNVSDYASGFLGFVLPLIGGVLAASVILDNAALELHFSTAYSAWRVILERQGLLLIIFTILALSFQLGVAWMGVDLSGLGKLFPRQLAWLVPTLSFMSLGCFSALALRKSQNGMMMVGLLWIIQVIARDWFMFYAAARPFFIFMSNYRPQHPDLLTNQLCQLGLSLAFFLLSGELLRRQERYI